MMMRENQKNLSQISTKVARFRIPILMRRWIVCIKILIHLNNKLRWKTVWTQYLHKKIMENLQMLNQISTQNSDGNRLNYSKRGQNSKK